MDVGPCNKQKFTGLDINSEIKKFSEWKNVFKKFVLILKFDLLKI